MFAFDLFPYLYPPPGCAYLGVSRDSSFCFLVCELSSWGSFTDLACPEPSLSKFVDFHPGGAHVLLDNDVGE
jgi:hypothetical protein